MSGEPDYVLIHAGMLDDVELQSLSAEEFGKKFLAAVQGEENCFTKYIAKGEA